MTKEPGHPAGQLSGIALAFCSCHRIPLLLETIRSVLTNLEDVDAVERILVIDDNSPVEQRYRLMREFPQLEYVFKGPATRGHARSLNYLVANLGCRRLLYWEDDCVLETRGRWLTRALDVLESDCRLISVSFDPSTEQDATCAARRHWVEKRVPWSHRIFMPRALGAYRHRAHFQYRRDPWPGFSLKPNLLAVDRASREVGLFDAEDNDHMEYDFGLRCVQSNLTTAILDGPVIRDTGKAVSAYVLNERRRAWE